MFEKESKWPRFQDGAWVQGEEVEGQQRADSNQMQNVHRARQPAGMCSCLNYVMGRLLSP